MKTLYDVQQLLKRFGTFIYVGSRLRDIALMKIELKALYTEGLIQKEEYVSAVRVLTKEYELEQSREGFKVEQEVDRN
ncbi:YqgQ family protein [Vagococcus acidifermentans]|uniref:Cytosolic protein n=1 Tax=Vagococcus acidifermentans TaxID=564710 RepID=A0A430AN04_9ENTE|nr:YqgQ family protein [Vagococcus acidifermentans]RSU09540.1 hypothetical protein CBF27_12590 [Vagococcus acidifermentans]